MPFHIKVGMNRLNSVTLGRDAWLGMSHTPLTFVSLSFPGVSFIFYFLCFWFCKGTIEEEELRSKQQLSKNEELVEDENVMHESTM